MGYIWAIIATDDQSWLILDVGTPARNASKGSRTSVRMADGVLHGLVYNQQGSRSGRLQGLASKVWSDPDFTITSSISNNVYYNLIVF